MGWYIHTCSRVSYKANYKPSELMCPTTHIWVPIEEVRPLLDQGNCFRFVEELPEAENRDNVIINNTLVGFDGMLMRFEVRAFAHKYFQPFFFIHRNSCTASSSNRRKPHGILRKNKGVRNIRRRRSFQRNHFAAELKRKHKFVPFLL